MNLYKGTCKVLDIISHGELALYFIFYTGKALISTFSPLYVTKIM